MSRIMRDTRQYAGVHQQGRLPAHPISSALGVRGATEPSRKRATRPVPSTSAQGYSFTVVGHERRVAHQAQVIPLVAIGCGAQEVHHEVRVRLEPEQARQLERAADGANLDAAAVGLEDARIEALDAHLHLGAPEPAHLGEGLRIDGIGARLHHQAHHAVGAVLVGGMLALDVVPGSGLPRGCLLPGGALAVQFGEGLVVRDAPAVHALLRLGDAARAALLVAWDAQALVPCAPLRRAGFGEAGSAASLSARNSSQTNQRR